MILHSSRLRAILTYVNKSRQPSSPSLKRLLRLPPGPALYWNCLRNADGDEPKALAKVRQKYFEEFIKKDLHFFLGTTQQWHQVAPNPWVIIGVFPIPPEHQLGLFG